MPRRKLATAWFVLVVALVAGLWLAVGSTPAPGQSTRGKVVRGGVRVVQVWGVGGVLTDDGKLWQYRPDRSRWMTIDESFRLDGEQRRVLPLPVPAREVQLMQGFGFLVTRNGVAWLYDLDSNRWRNLGTPGR